MHLYVITHLVCMCVCVYVCVFIKNQLNVEVENQLTFKVDLYGNVCEACCSMDPAEYNGLRIGYYSALQRERCTVHHIKNLPYTDIDSIPYVSYRGIQISPRPH
jgi:hypothetical protein